MTFTLQPKDNGSLIWTKLCLLCVIGMVMPVLEPYPYIPYDPLVSADFYGDEA